VSAASGGHGGNLLNNQVTGLRLDVDEPRWQQLRPADDASGWDSTGVTSPYLPNGKPAPRHTYTDINHVPELGRVLVGGRFWGNRAGDWQVLDGFRLADRDWDAPGTFANRPNAGPYLGARDPATGTWYSLTGYKFVPASTPAACRFMPFPLSGSATTGSMGLAFDTRRDFIYHLSSGNNFSAGGAINSCRIDKSTGQKTAIGFKDSAAYRDFQSRLLDFLGSTLVYDADSDCYYFFNGGAEGAHKVYRVLPNTSDQWDMDLLPVTGLPPGLSISLAVGGVNTKFFYVRRWRTCILVVPNREVYFLRVA
jgi:hypothetical protein